MLIVKVQLRIATSEIENFNQSIALLGNTDPNVLAPGEIAAHGDKCLIYTKDRKIINHEGNTDDVIRAKMKGRTKAFFFAKLINGKVALGAEAPWQAW